MLYSLHTNTLRKGLNHLFSSTLALGGDQSKKFGIPKLREGNRKLLYLSFPRVHDNLSIKGIYDP